MTSRAAPLILLLALAATPAAAQSLPAVKTTAANKVAACATPGRLMAFVQQRNASVDARFADIATQYMRHGEELSVRWDYAFFQMLLETGNLSYRRGNGKPGDVSPTQYNFAGLGATGRGAPGERFPDLSTGVKAHLQHLLLYAGDYITAPVAERTRKVQEWNVLRSWQKTIKGPMTFTHLGRQWAPGDRGYASKVGAIAKAFYDNHCNQPDPRPELVAEARKGRGGGETTKVAAAKETSEKVSGQDLARSAADQARAEGLTQRSSLGASGMAKQSVQAVASDFAASSSVGAAEPAAEETGNVTLAAAAAGAAATAAAKPKCRVWTASYGGQKAIIIKAPNDGFVNYTVLDVNEGAEKREAEAYIAAYARGGQAVGEFPNQSSALDKAFELCPEG